MHGFYRLNILRSFTILTLLLIGGSSFVVVVTNFRDPDVWPVRVNFLIFSGEIYSSLQ